MREDDEDAIHDHPPVKEPSNGNETLSIFAEKGRYLAIDLGGANFRVILVTLGPEKKFKIDTRIYAFPEEKMHAGSDEVSWRICFRFRFSPTGVPALRHTRGFYFSHVARNVGN